MSWPGPDEAAKQTVFAQFIGVSQQAVSAMVGRGVLPKSGTYSEWLALYLERLRTEAAGRDQDDRLSAARIRETEMNANLKEMEYLEKLGLVIWAADIEVALSELCDVIQTSVMSAQERIIDAIESKHSIKVDDDDVASPLRAALESVAGGAKELGRIVVPLTSGADAGGEGADGDMGSETP